MITASYPMVSGKTDPMLLKNAADILSQYSMKTSDLTTQDSVAGHGGKFAPIVSIRGFTKLYQKCFGFLQKCPDLYIV